jgi:hypothetical protein
MIISLFLGRLGVIFQTIPQDVDFNVQIGLAVAD